MDDVLISILGVAFLFGTPLFLGLIGGIIWRLNTLSKFRERENARSMYERLVADKLDVIKTALVMGMSRDELDHLDQRLEQLIGAEKMRTLLDDSNPVVAKQDLKIPATDLETELQGIEKTGSQREAARN